MISNDEIRAHTNAAILDKGIQDCLAGLRQVIDYQAEIEQKKQDFLALLSRLQALRILLKTETGA